MVRLQLGERVPISLRIAVLIVLFVLGVAALLAIAVGGNEEAESADPGPGDPSLDSIPSASADGPQLQPDVAVPALLERLPVCSEVWRVGRHLPIDYRGCRTEEATYASARWRCDPGSGRVASSPEHTRHARPGALIIPGTSPQVACRR